MERIRAVKKCESFFSQLVLIKRINILSIKI